MCIHLLSAAVCTFAGVYTAYRCGILFDRVMGIRRSRFGICRWSVCMATVDLWSKAVYENPIQIIYRHLPI
jgi:hypothetical protein